MADRLPRAVLRQGARGLQAADWFAGFADPKRELSEEIARLAACRQTAGMLEIAAMRRAVDAWPSAGWHEPEVAGLYRHDLLRALSNGDFLQRAVAAGAIRKTSC
jgi:hypothetical protein